MHDVLIALCLHIGVFCGWFVMPFGFEFVTSLILFVVDLVADLGVVYVAGLVL